jgi:hypothetical protein
MVEFSFTFSIIPLQWGTVQGFMSGILAINLLLLVILILAFLGVTWKRDKAELGALRARKLVLGLYVVFLVLSALIYIFGILQGIMPYMWGYIILGNPVMFFIFLSPPIPLMYLDIRLPESSGFFTSLSNSALGLLVWLVVIVIASGFSTAIISFPLFLSSLFLRV